MASRIHRISGTRRRVVRVEVEYADGEVQQLKDDEADRYQEIVISNAVVAFNQGSKYEAPKWVQLKPPREDAYES